MILFEHNNEMRTNWQMFCFTLYMWGGSKDILLVSKGGDY